jgi:pantoate kinase
MDPHTVKCGGHITLLFSIWKDARLARFQGSRGAGFNVVDGVEAKLECVGSNQPENPPILSQGSTLDEQPNSVADGAVKIEVTSMDGDSIVHSLTLYTDLIEALRDARLVKRNECFKLSVRLALPISQGFGMSAAGLVAVARAFRAHSGIGRDDQYLRIAHRIERIHSGGLGDVLGIAAGGVELRTEPGAPGAGGQAVGFSTAQPVLLVWTPDEERHTSNYIDDEKWQRSISEAGERAIRTLRLNDWSVNMWADLMLQSRNFAQSSGLLEEPERLALSAAVMEQLRDLGLQSKVYVRLCMLGVSLAILPRRLDVPLTEEDTLKIVKSLKDLQLGVVQTVIG